MADTCRLGGMKLSKELVQIDIRETGSTVQPSPLLPLLAWLAGEQLSLPHLHQVRLAEGVQTTLCIDAADFSNFNLDARPEIQATGSRVTPSVGTVSLFPHRFDIDLVGHVATVLLQSNIPILGLSSSVSTLVIHTDYSLLDDAAAAILTVCELPENHTPLRPVVVLGEQVVETVAVYYESRIGIYGMDLQEGLSGFQVEWTPEPSGAVWPELGGSGEQFRLVTAGIGDEKKIRFSCLVEKKYTEGVRERLEAFLRSAVSARLVEELKVDMVSFHGPHFQDRYGIAERSFAALEENCLKPLGVGCTGTSVQIVVAEGQGGECAACLREICDVPGNRRT